MEEKNNASLKPSIVDIHWCNLGCELSWEHHHRSSYTPPKVVRQLRRDLWALPLWTVGAGDYVLRPSGSLGDSTAIPYALPKEKSRQVWDTTYIPPRDCLPKDCVYQLRPWGIEVGQIPKLWQQIEQKTIRWQPLLPLLNRQASTIFFKRYNCVSTEATAYWITEPDEWFSWTTTICEQHPHWVLKLPYTSSGRGVFFLSSQQLAQELVFPFPFSVEPALERVADWAAEYWVESPERVVFLGFSQFDTSPSGHYIGTRLQAQHTLCDRFAQQVGGSTTVQQILADHLRFIKKEVAPHYRGYVGIDMLVYQLQHSLCMGVHPFVEINLRYTMGAYALDFYRTHEELCGRYSHFSVVPLVPNRPLTDYYPNFLLLSQPDAKSKFAALLTP